MWFSCVTLLILFLISTSQVIAFNELDREHILKSMAQIHALNYVCSNIGLDYKTANNSSIENNAEMLGATTTCDNSKRLHLLNLQSSKENNQNELLKSQGNASSMAVIESQINGLNNVLASQKNSMKIKEATETSLMAASVVAGESHVQLIQTFEKMYKIDLSEEYLTPEKISLIENFMKRDWLFSHSLAETDKSDLSQPKVSRSGSDIDMSYFRLGAWEQFQMVKGSDETRKKILTKKNEKIIGALSQSCQEEFQNDTVRRTDCVNKISQAKTVFDSDTDNMVETMALAVELYFSSSGDSENIVRSKKLEGCFNKSFVVMEKLKEIIQTIPEGITKKIAIEVAKDNADSLIENKNKVLEFITLSYTDPAEKKGKQDEYLKKIEVLIDFSSLEETPPKKTTNVLSFFIKDAFAQNNRADVDKANLLNMISGHIAKFDELQNTYQLNYNPISRFVLYDLYSNYNGDPSAEKTVINYVEENKAKLEKMRTQLKSGNLSGSSDREWNLLDISKVTSALKKFIFEVAEANTARKVHCFLPNCQSAKESLSKVNLPKKSPASVRVLELSAELSSYLDKKNSFDKNVLTLLEEISKQKMAVIKEHEKVAQTVFNNKSRSNSPASQLANIRTMLSSLVNGKFEKNIPTKTIPVLAKNVVENKTSSLSLKNDEKTEERVAREQMRDNIMVNYQTSSMDDAGKIKIQAMDIEENKEASIFKNISERYNKLFFINGSGN